jgi:hypothetical protein
MTSLRGPPGLEVCQRWYRSLFDADNVTSPDSWGQIVSSFRTRCLQQSVLDSVLDSYHKSVLGWSQTDVSQRISTKSWWEEITASLHDGIIGVDIYTLLHDSSNSPLIPIHCFYMDLTDFDVNTSSAIISACAHEGLRNFSLLASGIENPVTKIESIMTNLGEMSMRARIGHTIQVTVWLDVHHPEVQDVIKSEALSKFLPRSKCQNRKPQLSIGVLVPNTNVMKEYFTDKTKQYPTIPPLSGLHRKYGESYRESYNQLSTASGGGPSNNPGKILEKLILLSLGQGCETYVVPRDVLCTASPSIPFLPAHVPTVKSVYPDIQSDATADSAAISTNHPVERNVYIGTPIGDRVAIPDHAGACPQLLHRGKITVTTAAHVIMPELLNIDLSECTFLKPQLVGASLVAATISAGLVGKLKDIIDGAVTESIPIVSDIVVGIQGLHSATRESHIHLATKLAGLMTNVPQGLRAYVHPIPCLSLSMLFNVSNGLGTNIMPYRYYPCSKTMLPIVSADHVFDEWTKNLGKAFSSGEQLTEYYKFLLRNAGQSTSSLMQYQLSERGDIERAFGKPYGAKLFVRYEDITAQVNLLQKAKKRKISLAIGANDESKSIVRMREKMVASAIRCELIGTVERTFCVLPDLVPHNCNIVNKALGSCGGDPGVDHTQSRYLCMLKRVGRNKHPSSKDRMVNYFKELLTHPKSRRMFLESVKLLWDGFVIITSIAHIPMFPNIKEFEKLLALFAQTRSLRQSKDTTNAAV